MPLFVYSHKRNNFVFATPGEVNSYAQMRPRQFQLPCWGWGTLMSDPKKGYIKTEGWGAKRREKVFVVRMWINFSGVSRTENMRVQVRDVYAEGIQYLMKGDPVCVYGSLVYDKLYSQYKKQTFFIIEADMTIPPYSADGRQFCARKNAVIERSNSQMFDQIVRKGEIPGAQDLREYMEKQRELSKFGG